MLHLIGLATLGFTGLTTIGVVWALWASLKRPWLFRPRLPVPKEVKGLNYVVPDQDNPIPWI